MRHCCPSPPFLLLLLLLLAPHAAADDDTLARFARFKRVYRKRYRSPAEEARRFQAFAATLSRAAARNHAGAGAAVHGVNQFADMTPREFRLMATRPAAAPRHPIVRLVTTATPSAASAPHVPYDPPAPVRCSRNWASTFPASTPIRDQDKCGGCWAYALAETTRLQFVARHGADSDPGLLSAEYLLDCAKPAWTAQNCSCWSWGTEKTCYDGCCGGEPLVAANWLAAVGGIPTAAAYGGRGRFDKNLTYNVTRSAADPFTPFPCDMTVPKAVRPVGPPLFFAPGRNLNMTIALLQQEKAAAAAGGAAAVSKLFCDKYDVCPGADGKYVSPETQLAQYVCEVGPVEIGVSTGGWDTYVSGVLTASQCSNETQSHSVEVVGVDADKQAWIVRNHWGPQFGVSPTPPYLPAAKTPGGNGGGYLLLAFGENTCRMAEVGFAHPELETV